jgi:S-DNA-T family DNA segregation ATPase FtsK/SpoIIIE
MEIKKIAKNSFDFVINRLIEISGILVSILGTLVFIALITYSADDPNFIFPDNTEIKNLLGFHGSFTSDLLFQSFGLSAYLIQLTFFFTGINIFLKKDFFIHY